MKFSYTELLVMFAVLLVAVIITWTTVYVFAPSQPTIIHSGSTDGPELRKATKMIMESVNKGR